VSVEVNGVSTADAYEKMGYALGELRKFLIPVSWLAWQVIDRHVKASAASYLIK
jgi:hypothetical protein